MPAPFRPPRALSEWSVWVPLREIGRNKQIPASPGLYRIRHFGFEGLDYIGETGGRLRARLAMLGGIFRDVMPYRAPHTAGPALWALRDSKNWEFEAATTVFNGTDVERKGLEALAITLYRVKHRGSPTVNFGWMPSGYRKSSGNNAHLVASGKRFRGGRDPEVIANAESVPVHGALEGNVTSRDWMGWEWSSWVPAAQSSGAPQVGLYRLQLKRASRLIYVGQGRIAARIRAHLAKALTAGHPQAHHFAQTLEVSWVGFGGPPLHLLEHENDLIASHVLTRGGPPAAQFSPSPEANHAYASGQR